MHFPSGERLICSYFAWLIAAVFVLLVVFSLTVSVQIVLCSSVSSFFLSATVFSWITSEETRQLPPWVTRMLMRTRPPRATFSLCGILAETFQVFLSHQREEDVWRARTLEARRSPARVGLRHHKSKKRTETTWQWVSVMLISRVVHYTYILNSSCKILEKK